MASKVYFADFRCPSWRENLQQKLARLMSTISCEGVGVLWDVHHPYRFMHEKPETTYQNLRPISAPTGPKPWRIW